MSNTKQMSLNEEAIYDEKKEKKKSRKSFMEYAIWVDFPVNAALLTAAIVGIVRAFQMGLDVAMEKGLPSMGNESLDAMLAWSLPMMVVYIGIAVVVELIYLILKLCKKQPFITEKYAIGILIGKVFWILFFGAAVLFF